MRMLWIVFYFLTVMPLYLMGIPVLIAVFLAALTATYSEGLVGVYDAKQAERGKAPK